MALARNLHMASVIHNVIDLGDIRNTASLPCPLELPSGQRPVQTYNRQSHQFPEHRRENTIYT